MTVHCGCHVRHVRRSLRSRWRASTRWSVTTPPTTASVSTPHSPQDLRPVDPWLIHASRVGGARQIASWTDTGGTSATGASTWVPALATSWNEPASLTAAPSPSSTPMCHDPRSRLRRLRRLDVTAIEADVCKPLPVGGPFDSAALNGVIHCLPGPLRARLPPSPMSPPSWLRRACSFGASILGHPGDIQVVREHPPGNNRRGTFDNLGDTQGRPRRDP